MSEYIYDKPNWPKFYWDKEALAEKLTTVHHQQGRLLGRMESLGFQLQREAVLIRETPGGRSTSYGINIDDIH